MKLLNSLGHDTSAAQSFNLFDIKNDPFDEQRKRFEEIRNRFHVNCHFDDDSDDGWDDDIDLSECTLINPQFEEYSCPGPSPCTQIIARARRNFKNILNISMTKNIDQ